MPTPTDRASTTMALAQTVNPQLLKIRWRTILRMKDCLPESGHIKVENPWQSLILCFYSEELDDLPEYRDMHLWSPVVLDFRANHLCNFSCSCRSVDECCMIRTLWYLNAKPVLRHMTTCTKCDTGFNPASFTLEFGPPLTFPFTHFMALPLDVRLMVYSLIISNDRNDRRILMSRGSSNRNAPQKLCDAGYSALLTCSHLLTTASSYHPGDGHWLALRLVNKKISFEFTSHLVKQNEICFESASDGVAFLDDWRSARSLIRSVHVPGLDWQNGRSFIDRIMHLDNLHRLRFASTVQLSRIMATVWSMKPWMVTLGADQAAIDHMLKVVTFGDCETCGLSFKLGTKKGKICECDLHGSRNNKRTWVTMTAMLGAQLHIENSPMGEEEKGYWKEVDEMMQTGMQYTMF